GILVLLSNYGEIIWINTSSIVGLYPNAVLYSEDNKYLVSAYEMYCIDENCNLIWDSESKPVGNDKYIKILDDNYIVFTGLHSLPYNNHIVSLSKANAEGNIVSIDSSNFNQSSQSFLIENCPNPFTLKTSISFFVPNVSNVEISIYNIKGQKVKTITNEICQKGQQQVVWNGDDNSGNNVGAGVYFYELKMNGKTEAIKKCIMLK
ncbi:MAG: T9SS type A sorting domain-containing protein, partial [Candidatus Cloacimonetes bacterium]|nr:T9SS type A sorting domain-containing protein [Candidatus Cloacimonadota bacterium]